VRQGGKKKYIERARSGEGEGVTRDK